MNIRHVLPRRLPFFLDTLFLTTEKDYLVSWSFFSSLSLLFFSFFLLYRCIFTADFLLEIFIRKNNELIRNSFSFHSLRDIFLLRHSLGKLGISFLLLLLLFFFSFCSFEPYVISTWHTHIRANFSRFFLTQILPVFEPCVFILFVFLADVSCKFSSITAPTSDSQ